MTSEAVGSEPSATTRRVAAPIVARPPLTPPVPAIVVDAALALGYEAADPALHAPLWTEAMQAASRPLR